MEKSIIIKTKNGKEITIARKAAELSEFLKEAMNDYPNETVFTLDEIDEKYGSKMKEYLEHINGVPPKEIPKPIPCYEMKKLTDGWSANFIDKLSLEEVVNLTVVANQMGIKSLLDLCCAKVATIFKDREEKEVFRHFGIKESITEKDTKKLKELKEQNKWIEDNL